jgi:RNA polymerase sigma factor (sigma-70 family)
MAGGPLQGLLQHLRRALAPGDDPGLSDAQLLERFAASRDEAAFELLVWRHGGMVLGLCRRLLRHEQDAEDCCQAAFLALARRADSIQRHESVGGWLYRVAHRAALRCRTGAASRRAREGPLHEPPTSTALGPAEEAARREFVGVLDKELSRLPGKYREAFVLCTLAGKSNAEAARELGCAVGTVESRLTRARARLRAALARRGLAPPACLPVGVLAAGLFSPRVAGALARAAAAFATGATVPAESVRAAALAEVLVRGMIMTRFKVVAALALTAGLLGFGTALVGPRAPGGPAPAAAWAPAPIPKAKRPTDAATLRRQLEGVWTVERYSVGGPVQGGPGPKWETVRIERGAWSQSSRVDGRELWTTPYLITLGPKEATRIDLAYRGHKVPVLRGVLHLEGNRLTVTLASSGARPASHSAPLRAGQVRWVLRLTKP